MATDSSTKPKQNPKKANLLDHHSLKHILDESAIEVSLSLSLISRNWIAIFWLLFVFLLNPDLRDFGSLSDLISSFLESIDVWGCGLRLRMKYGDFLIDFRVLGFLLDYEIPFEINMKVKLYPKNGWWIIAWLSLWKT